MKTGAIVAALAATLGFSAAASAQDISATPLYGSLALNSGFTPDPTTVEVQAGGSDDASMLGAGCGGYINNAAPDISVDYSAGGGFPLNIYVNSSADTTLVVRQPNGSWACNDDSSGLNPWVSLTKPQSGTYHVWIGTWSAPGSISPATLYVSELEPQWTAVAGAPDIAAPPIYGTLNLVNGFSPDPTTVALQAGGPDDASLLGPECWGYINNAAPDVDLNYTAGGGLPLNIYVSSDSDTTLVINQPDGSWVCNDDYDNVNPMVSLANPQSGLYNIWVGNWDGSGIVDATLNVSELPPQFAGGGSGVASPDLGAAPLYGTLDLANGFTPDPASMAVDAGGGDDAYALGMACTGYINNVQPDVNLNYAAATGVPLSIFVQSQADTTLVVNGPDGQWYCNDDASGLNPSVGFKSPQSGLYNIWIGTFEPGATSAATVNVSELPPQW